MACSIVARAMFGTSIWPAVWVSSFAVIFAFLDRPSYLAVLIEVDRRLGLHELLSTAASIRGANPDTQSVLAQAEQAARGIDVRGVLHDAKPARAMTSAALAVAASVGLSLALARPAAPRSETTSADVARRTMSEQATPAADARPEPASPRSFGEGGERSASASAAKSADGPTSGSSDAAGAAAASSMLSLPNPPANATDVATGDARPAGVGGGGSTAATAGPARDAGASRGRLEVSSIDRLGPASAVGEAFDAELQRVPPASRDVVRRFFTPDGEGRP